MLSSKLGRLVSGLRLLGVPGLGGVPTPRPAPVLVSPHCRLGTAPLPPGQTVMRDEGELRAETVGKINSALDGEPGRLFAVIYIRGHQHKVTDGDLVMVQTDIGAPVGAKIHLHKLLALGSKDFTLLGRPLLPFDLAHIEATVIEKTLSRTKVVQFFKPRERCKHVKFQRSKWTLLRITGVAVPGRLGNTTDRAGCEKHFVIN